MKTRIIALCLGVALIVSLVGTANAYLPGMTEPWQDVNQTALAEAEVSVKMATMQIPFIANQGQQDDQVAFYANTFGGTVFVTTTGHIVYALPKTAEDDQTLTGVALHEELVGARVPQVMGADKAVTQVSYFKGKDSSQWQSNIATYQSVYLGEVYEGIELTLKAYGNNVEKLFTVQPGAAPEIIQLKLQGAERLTINDAGELEVETALGVVTFTTPIAYQEIAGNRKAVDVAYTTHGEHYGFQVGNYDTTHDLIIDPLLASTFLGGSVDDLAFSIILDGSGYVYVFGGTSSSDFPTTPGVYDTSFGGPGDFFIAKLTPDLSTLLASTFLGGGNFTVVGSFITLDSSGNVYVTGEAYGPDFPTTTGAYDTEHNGSSDVFLSKLTPDLSNLLASTFLGGSLADRSHSITLDSSGQVYVIGYTFSSNFPATMGAYDTTYNGARDVFVSKLSSDLSTLSASTFLGEGDLDYGKFIILDGAGNAYVTGYTRSTNFPTTTGAYDTSHNGGGDAFVTKLQGDLSTILASTFLGGGGTADDDGYTITLDGSGQVYVTGVAWSSSFPTTTGAYDTSHNGGADAFVSKLTSNLSTLLASTFLGGSTTEYASSSILASSGQIYVAGFTNSSNFPTSSGAYNISFNGGPQDGFVSRLSPDLSTLLASTFLGGPAYDQVGAITLDGSGQVYVAGRTQSSGFPTTAGAYDQSHNGSSDAFIARFDGDLSASPPTVSKEITEGMDRNAATSIFDVFAGDMFTYTIEIENPFESAYYRVTDALDEAIEYVLDSFLVNGSPAGNDPFATGDLLYADHLLGAGEMLTLSFQVEVQDVAMGYLIDNSAWITAYTDPLNIAGTTLAMVEAVGPQSQVIPEPTTLLLVGFGLLGLFGIVGRKRKG